MGWIGLGALIASVSYLLYKHPPASWVSWIACWRQQQARRLGVPKDNDDSRAIQQPAQASTSETHEDRDNTILRQESKRQQNAGLEGDASPDTTPKAAAAPQDRSSDVEIPVLNLDGASRSSKESRPSPTSDAAGGCNATASALSSAGQSKPATNITSPTSSSSSSSPSISSPNSMRPPPTPKSQNQTNPMSPPPRPPGLPSLRPPPSAAAPLRAPPSRSPGTSSLAPPPSLSAPPNPQKASRKVVLEPGYSPLDWAALTSDPRNNLRGANLPPTLIRVTPTMLKAHNGRKGADAWTSFRGKVYNITPYIPFHPGGKGEIMRGAGKDSEKLFMETHPWVNWDGMLGECLVGILVSENDGAVQRTALDEMD